MQLIERNENSGKTRAIKVLKYVDSRDGVKLVVEEVYSSGLGIQHFLADAAGGERRIEILSDCPLEKPYTAFGRFY
jgi:hypothetical protein